MRTADPSPADANPHYAKLDRIRSKAPVLLALALHEIAKSRQSARDEALARARRVGRDHGVVGSYDLGPSIRHQTIVADDGAVLREADVETAHTGDPNNPRVIIRRARRTDPLIHLHRIGTLDHRRIDAAERLRRALEKSMPSVPTIAQSEVHVSPFWRVEIGRAQLRAVETVRDSQEAIGAARWGVTLWVCLGGSISGFAAFAHCAKATASARLSEGLNRLADHYGLPMPP